MTEHQSSTSPAMRFGRIPGVEKPVSRIVLGSVAFEEQDREQTHEILDAFASVGGNAIDTARHYGDRAEGAIGSWLRSRANRERMVLIGKGGHPHAGRSRINPRDITTDLRASLAVLDTDYLDLFLLHRDDPSIPVGEIVEWLNEHVRAGRVRAVGGSNWHHERLEEANAYAAQNGLPPLVVSSPNLSLGTPNEPLWQGCLSLTREDRDWHTRTQLPVLAWSSQAQGFFTGRFRPDDRSNEVMTRIWYNDANFQRLDRVERLARRQDVPPVAVALAWVLHQPFPTFAVIGPRSPAELHESAQALRVALTPDDVRRLEGPEG